MSQNLKIFLGISYLFILSLFLYFIFLQIDVSRLNDFSYYKEIQINLEDFIGNNIYLNLLFFFVFSIIWVILLGFGLPLLIVSGILFGKWIGTFISVISISLGALILYSIATFFFADSIQNMFKGRFAKYIALFKKNEFFYFFVYRFVGGLGVPFPLQNILPVIFRMGKSNYFFSSLLGLIPNFFILNTIGSGLNDFIKQADNFNFLDLILNKQIYLPIILFIILLIVATIVRKKIFGKT
tara:strand:- start:64 stop:783 length:720 start_codon:yes stop_codon:yes gene_type:complete